MPDERDSGTEIQVSCDGTALHKWHVTDHKIVQPTSLQGKPFMHGFITGRQRSSPAMHWKRRWFCNAAILLRSHVDMTT